MIKCPVCRAPYKLPDRLSDRPLQPESDAGLAPASAPTLRTCRRCGADLSALIRLHDQAVGHYHQAIAAFNQHQLATAIDQIQQAIALNSRQADFHAFAGQLWALQGEWQQAIASWQRAQQLDPQCSRAIEALKLIEQLASALA